MSQATLRGQVWAEPEPTVTAHRADAGRLRAVIDEHHAFVWRSVRRLGVAESEVDDAVQKVFLVLTDRLSSVPPGRERSFLFATALRVAANERRANRRRRHDGVDDLDIWASVETSTPEATASDRLLLDRLLAGLPLELRSVFVLFELEQMTAEEIAGVLDLPAGTVASRLRRARELVQATFARIQARDRARGEPT